MASSSGSFTWKTRKKIRKEERKEKKEDDGNRRRKVGLKKYKKEDQGLKGKGKRSRSKKIRGRRLVSFLSGNKRNR